MAQPLAGKTAAVPRKIGLARNQGKPCEDGYSIFAGMRFQHLEHELEKF